MKRIYYLFIIVLSVSCKGQIDNSATTPFGNYYKISTYDIWVPFLGNPVKNDYNNQAITGVDYKFASENPKDTNVLYACSAYKLILNN